jgi:hypothetical protein
MSKQPVEINSVSITSVSDAQPYFPGMGTICKVQGSVSPPRRDEQWNLHLFKIMNFPGNRNTIDHTNSLIRDLVKTQGRNVGNVNTMNGEWSHTGPLLAYCGVDNIVVVVAIWKPYLGGAPVEYSGDYPHRPDCTANCWGIDGAQFRLGY